MENCLDSSTEYALSSNDQFPQQFDSNWILLQIKKQTNKKTPLSSAKLELEKSICLNTLKQAWFLKT